MPRRKKRWWRPRLKSESIRSIVAITTMLLGVLLAIALIGHTFGADNFFHEFSTFLFGSSAFFIPVVLLSLGLNLTKFKHAFAQPRALWGSVLFFVGTVIFLGSLFENGAGWIGTAVTDPLSKYITSFGGVVAGIAILFIALLIGFNMTLQEFSEKIAPIVRFFSIRPKLPKRKKEKEDTTEEGIDEETYEAPDKEPIFPELPNTVDDETSPQIEIVEETQSSSAPAPIPPTKAQQQSIASDVDEDELSSVPYTPPPITILNEIKKKLTDQDMIQRNARIIESTLGNFGIQARIAEVNIGPAVTQYAINLAEGTRSSKITSLQNDIALSLASPTGSVRIEAPIPGKRLIGIEVPNNDLTIVGLKAMLTSEKMQSDPSPMAVALGEDVSGKPVISHISKWPHILIAGSTGSGKSILIHSIINSILFRATPEQVRFIMVDPKRVELTQYNTLPHLQTPVIVDSDKTVAAFKWSVTEMERRYRLFQQLGARNLEDFNRITDTEKLPYIVIIVDELADLMMYAANDMETLITRIAQKARATGIHMVLSTQRPSVDVITGLIKANIPTRIALNVSSATDSRVILDSVGAEKLLGKGDMLYLPPDAGKPKRIQGVFLSNEEVHKITEYMSQFEPGYKTSTPHTDQTRQEVRVPQQQVPGYPQSVSDPITEYGQHMTDVPDDDKFIDAVRVMLNHDKASASLLQRRLKVGYARAARILDELEEKGLVGPPDGSNPREVNTEKARAYIEQLGSTDIADTL